ncbi:MAG TPA: hypothetical protein VF456_17005 [Vicinamibacterales bacterium]
MLIDALDQAIKQVCPIHGIAMNDGRVIRIDFADEATQDQRAAAQQVVETFDYSEAAQAVSVVPVDEVVTEIQQ